MHKKKLLLISFITILLLAIFHILALKFSWYWRFRWIHIFAHIAGGFWIALMSLWIALKIGHIEKITHYKKRALIVMLGSALLVGILWEVFELIFKIDLVQSIGYWPYTSIAVAGDFTGGIIAYLYFMKDKKTANILPAKPENNLILPMIIKTN